MKQQKGITLIALIITIVVMLILVAVTLSIALGQNGVVTQGREAGTGMNDAHDKEDAVLNDPELGTKINSYVESGTGFEINTAVEENN